MIMTIRCRDVTCKRTHHNHRFIYLWHTPSSQQLNAVPDYHMQHETYYHWKHRDVMIPTLSSLVVSRIIVMISYGATSPNKCVVITVVRLMKPTEVGFISLTTVIMTTLDFQWLCKLCNRWRQPFVCVTISAISHHMPRCQYHHLFV